MHITSLLIVAAIGVNLVGAFQRRQQPQAPPSGPKHEASRARSEKVCYLYTTIDRLMCYSLGNQCHWKLAYSQSCVVCFCLCVCVFVCRYTYIIIHPWYQDDIKWFNVVILKMVVQRCIENAQSKCLTGNRNIKMTILLIQLSLYFLPIQCFKHVIVLAASCKLLLLIAYCIRKWGFIIV